MSPKEVKYILRINFSSSTKANWGGKGNCREEEVFSDLYPVQHSLKLHLINLTFTLWEVLCKKGVEISFETKKEDYLAF